MDSVVIKSLSDKGLSLADINQLVNAIWLPDDEFRKIESEVLRLSSALRKVVFNGSLVAMAPIETSNACASDCDFCGWRSTNGDMKRMRISPETILAETRYFLEKGVRNIEYVCGDNPHEVRDVFPGLIRETRKMLDEVGGGRIQICTMALTENQYRELKDYGADGVITWQESYDPEIYQQHIKKGPKAFGITEDWKVDKEGDGYRFRVESQDRAARAGLEVAVGSMLGLNENTNFEVLATLAHVRHLIEHYDFDERRPVVIGMPTWNHIPTPRTDNKPAQHIDTERIFPYISALYFLAMPRKNTWVFPNCRVSLPTQIKAIKAGGVFTSTEVKVGPGGYLPQMLTEAIAKKDEKEIQHLTALVTKDLDIPYDPQTQNPEDIAQILNKREQFSHHYHPHEEYVRAFAKEGLVIVPGTHIEHDNTLETIEEAMRVKIGQEIVRGMMR